MTNIANDPVDYEVELIPVELVRVGDTLRIPTNRGVVVSLIENIELDVRRDDSGMSTSVYKFTSALVDGEPSLPKDFLRSVAVYVAGSLVERIVSRIEP